MHLVTQLLLIQKKIQNNFVFANSIKIDICNFSYLQLKHNLPTPANDSDFPILLSVFFRKNS